MTRIFLQYLLLFMCIVSNTVYCITYPYLLKSYPYKISKNICLFFWNLWYIDFMMNTILHIDVNSAFLSWTAVKRLKEDPDSIDLRTVPSAIGGDKKTRHGIITAKSIPASKLGVKTAMPVVKALELCPDLILAESDFETYRVYSHAFIDVLKNYSDIVEQVSIDEAFIDLTDKERAIKSLIFQQIVDGTLSYRDSAFGFLSNDDCVQLKKLVLEHNSLISSIDANSLFIDTTNTQDSIKAISASIRRLIDILDSGKAKRTDVFKLLPFPINVAFMIKTEIHETLGFTVNVGISTNKLLAKMASDLEKPDKIHTLFPSEIPIKMWPLPIGDLFGCGGKSAMKLEKIGIHTIGDAANMNLEVLSGLLGRNSGIYIHNAANGFNYSTVSSKEDEAKSISNELTSSVDIDSSNYETEGLMILRKLSKQVSQRLKKQGLYAGTIGINVKTDDFKRRSLQRKLLDSTNDQDQIYTVSLELMNELLLGTINISGDGSGYASSKIQKSGISDLSLSQSLSSDINLDTTKRGLALPDANSGLFGMGYKIRLLCVSASNFDHGAFRQMTLDELMNSSKEIEKEKKLLKKNILKQKKQASLSKLLSEKFGDSIVKKGFGI